MTQSVISRNQELRRFISDSEGIIHKELVPCGQMVNVLCLDVLKRFIRPQGRCHMLHNNARSKAV